ASGSYQSSLTVQGSQFSPSGAVQLFWDQPSSTPLAATTAGGTGAFSQRISLPQAPLGAHTLLALDQATGSRASALVQVTPRAAPSSGQGYGANELVTVSWNCSPTACSSPTTLGTATTDASGSFRGLAVTIPASGVTAGTTYSLRGKGSSSGASAFAQFTI